MITLQKAIDEYIEVRKPSVSPRTTMLECAHLGIFVEFVGRKDFPLHQLNRTHIQRWIDFITVRRKRSAESVAGYIARFLTWAFNVGYTRTNIHAGVPLPRKPLHRKREPFTEEEYRLLLAAAGNRPIALMIMLGWYTGMSVSDCADLRWCHVDLEECFIRKRRQKTKVMSTIPFEPGGELHQRLLQMRKRPLYTQPDDLVAYENNCENRERSVMSMFAILCKRVGIKGKSFHNFRATLATHLANQGTNLMAAMQITGHASPAIFARYATVAESKVVDAARGVRWSGRPAEPGEEVQL